MSVFIHWRTNYRFGWLLVTFKRKYLICCVTALQGTENGGDKAGEKETAETTHRCKWGLEGIKPTESSDSSPEPFVCVDIRVVQLNGSDSLEQ